MTCKYEITDIAHPDNPHLFRIRALVDIPSVKVKAGELGGYVQSEHNLSQEDNCWISDDAVVYENAQVFDNAVVFDNAQVFDNARVFGNSLIYKYARVFGTVKVHKDMQVTAKFTEEDYLVWFFTHERQTANV